MRRRSLAALFAASLPLSTASACEFCLISQGISPLQTLHGAGLRVNQRYSLLDEIYQGDQTITNPGVSERFWTTEFSGFYSLNERLLLIATLPLRKTEGNGDVSTGVDGDVEVDTATGDDSGLGDLALLGRYTMLSQHTLASTSLLAASVGVKLPTGSTDGRDDNGNFLDAHIQPGTGSTDVLLGMSASHAVRRWNLSSNLLAAITTEGEFGATRHQFGDSINYDITAKYRLSPQTPGAAPVQWFMSFGLNGEWRGHEHDEDLRVPDSGGHVMYLTPGLQLVIGRQWVVEASFQQAVYRDLNGTQTGETYKISGGITYLF